MRIELCKKCGNQLSKMWTPEYATKMICRHCK